MKKILGVIFLSLLLSGCGDFYKGNKYLAQAGVSKNAGQYGWSNTSLRDAENNAMATCEVFKNRKLGFGLDKNKTCRVIGSYINPNHPGTQNEIALLKQKEIKDREIENKVTQQRELENEYGRYIKQCEYIGFKKNTDKMGECVLKLHSTEIQLAQLNIQKRTADSADVATNMFLLNESLKLLNPPQPKGFNCRASTVGVFMNVNCN
ncbi:hypothetical protein PQZ72_01975 [Candidatus Pelagibacter sp.]|nr:hypothetical protein [Candidatus Pelagibacter sp.]MDA9167791.1 hypothetical protein [Candidatus Pelagibacter sp.]MDA9796023.1 hypothetical protein [Candidatus Pelagibacter ubique]MDC6476024.1 hypothetical protein [Candidatus Pelagibacter sp.]